MAAYTYTSVILLSLIPLISAKKPLMFEYPSTHDNLSKLVVYDQAMAKEFVLSQKPKGLHKTRLDWEFPEGPNTNERYRVIQYLLNGYLDEYQKELYTDLELEFEGKEPYSKEDQACTSRITLRLLSPGTVSKPSQFSEFQHNVQGAEVFKNNDSDLDQSEVEGWDAYLTFKLTRSGKRKVKFKNCFGQDLDMNHFLVFMKIYGKCHKYYDVTLLKPNNLSDEL